MWPEDILENSAQENTYNLGMSFSKPGYSPLYITAPPPPGPPQDQPMYSPSPEDGSTDQGNSPPAPPIGPQSYGATVTTPGGHSYQPGYFQYSQCTRKKKALCIGINYTGTGTEPLHGCVDDAKNIRQFLIDEYGYNEDDIVLLTDDQDDPGRIPTRENMIIYFNWLVLGAQPDDSLFLHYSGHGDLVLDKDGDEESGYDEVILPVDHVEAGPIVDDELHDILVKHLPSGCRLTALFDSCHSGTVLDLPFVYDHSGKVKQRSRTLESVRGVWDVISKIRQHDLEGTVNTVAKTYQVATGKRKAARDRTLQMKCSPADVICWGSCKDEQTARETYESGKVAGTLSYAFMAALRKDKKQSYQQLLVDIRKIVLNDKPEYNQKPQLSSSHPMDMELLFIC